MNNADAATIKRQLNEIKNGKPNEHELNKILNLIHKQVKDKKSFLYLNFRPLESVLNELKIRGFLLEFKAENLILIKFDF